MRLLTSKIALTALLLAAPAFAQDAPATAESAEIGKTYNAATHGDWALQCVKPETKNDPCEIYQVLKTAEGNALADMSIVSLPEGGEAVAGITIMVPLETFLPGGLVLKVDDQETRTYPFTFCAQPGCFARMGFTQAELDTFKKGSKATLSVVPVAKANQRVEVSLSLKGFSDAFEAVKASNAKTAEAAKAAAKPAQ